MSPLVSIIIPVYNAEPWVASCLESALKQTWVNLEIIAVNDGSKDASLEVLRRQTDPRIRVVDQPNRGAAAARNAGLSLARGDFIQFLDADDLLAPDKIRAQMSAIGGGETDTLATSRWARFRSDVNSAEFSPSALFADFKPVDYLLANVSTGEMMHPAAWLVPAQVAKKAGMWNESLSLNDDGEYFARVALASRQVKFVPAATSFYRSGLPVSLSGRGDRRALESLFHSCELVAKSLRSAEDSPRVRTALADYYQRLAFELYPGAPDLHRQAVRHVAELGGSRVRPQMGSRQALVARLTGWKLAKRIASWRPR